VPFSFKSTSGLFVSLLEAIEPAGGDNTESVTHNQCDARSTVTFAAARHCHCPEAGTGGHKVVEKNFPSFPEP